MIEGCRRPLVSALGTNGTRTRGLACQDLRRSPDSFEVLVSVTSSHGSAVESKEANSMWTVTDYDATEDEAPMGEPDHDCSGHHEEEGDEDGAS